jgi:hypothetical protein
MKNIRCLFELRRGAGWVKSNYRRRLRQNSFSPGHRRYDHDGRYQACRLPSFDQALGCICEN